jgi:hypothetical protein
MAALQLAVVSFRWEQERAAAVYCVNSYTARQKAESMCQAGSDGHGSYASRLNQYDMLREQRAALVAAPLIPAGPGGTGGQAGRDGAAPRGGCRRQGPPSRAPCRGPRARGW